MCRALESLKLPQKTIDSLVKELKKTNESKNIYHRNAINSLQQEYNQAQDRLDRLMDLLIDRSITKDEYDKKLSSLKEKQHEIGIKLEEHTNADESYHITASTVLNLAKRAKTIFENSEVPEKRQFLNYLLQNAMLNGKKLEFSLRNPFNHIVKLGTHTSLLHLVNDVRTSFPVSV